MSPAFSFLIIPTRSSIRLSAVYESQAPHAGLALGSATHNIDTASKSRSRPGVDARSGAIRMGVRSTAKNAWRRIRGRSVERRSVLVRHSNIFCFVLFCLVFCAFR